MTTPLRRYDFDRLHDGIKKTQVNIDFFAYGMEGLGLVLFFGDLMAARAAHDKLAAAHARILERVQGVATADR